MSQIEPHFGPCFSARNISDGEIVPIGGRNRLTETMDIGVRADFSAFQPLFENAAKTYSGIDTAALARTLEERGVDADSRLYAASFAFNKAMMLVHPNASSNIHERQDMYRDDQPPKLSEVVANGCAMCAEIALLAHAFLNHVNIPNRFFNGQLLGSKSHEFGDEHSFVVLDNSTRPVIYDPARPTVRENGQGAPSLYNVDERKLKQMMAAKESNFLWVKNAVSGGEEGYGVSSGRNIWPEQIVDASPLVLVARSAAPTPVPTVKASAS